MRTTVRTASRRACRRLVRAEEGDSALGAHAHAPPADEPLQDVEVVAALCDDHRRRRLAVVPVAAHERVRHVSVHHRLLVLDVNEFADEPQVNRLLERAEVGRVAQHVPDRDHDAGLALAREQVEAFALRLRHRLFEQHVVALAHRLHRGFEVQGVGKRHEHHVGELSRLACVEHFVVVAEAAFPRDAPLVAHAFAARSVDVRHRDDPHRFRKQLAVGGILVPARASAHHRDGYFATRRDLQRLYLRQLSKCPFNVHDLRCHLPAREL